MAYIEINVGPVTRRIAAGDAQAQRVLGAFLDQYGHDRGSMTAAQQLDAVLTQTVSWYQESARAYETGTPVDTARAGVEADPPLLDGA